MKKILFYAIGLLIYSNEAHANELNLELEAIKMIESSDGTNTNHRTLTTGMHAGSRAGGYYGLMPITAKEFMERNPKTFANYQHMVNWEHNKVTEELNKNRRLDNKIARIMWAKFRKTRSAEEAACAWFWGPYASKCKDPAQREVDAYVLKFRDALLQERVALAAN